jgi:hypothetical protein
LQLSASAVAGASYNWTGPNGFTATGQNVSIPNATVSHAGQYTVTATANGCSNTAYGERNGKSAARQAHHQRSGHDLRRRQYGT